VRIPLTGQHANPIFRSLSNAVGDRFQYPAPIGYKCQQHSQKQIVSDIESLSQQVVELASEYGRYGYRQVTAMLRNDERTINH